ncbi:ATP-grasp fold, subdomain 2 [Metarhizium guizhouense ARSEF 977]|uniref:ATP-grasp fold, subdomain 2 n=1 Tax=Metarhizium guizhouense (strain ARSEF 977) TaxID=1276136 RepID=A0A0B4G4F8_METGA|nr:ATP-grasp fold, subdomain 2 [Metarhizium guizhouense ARSEF 977]
MSTRLFSRLLVANRGEIAVRIIQAARELSPPVETFALYTDDDAFHCSVGCPDHAIRLPSAASYLDMSLLVKLAQEHDIGAVHPGYGFLSESAEFARQMKESGILVIGPGPEILARTGDKLQAKQLALECHVPVLPAMTHPVADLASVREFIQQVGYPVMVKAVDGGGGRGIRLVQNDGELENSVRAATNESPSKSVFAEKAATDGFHHIEIQVIGDGTNATVCHLWERDCSVQRRFQKIVEVAPALFSNRGLIDELAGAAVRMARAIRYQSLGTVEFLVNEKEDAFYFLEINPRLQVEHTITESVSGVDLVQTQLRVAQGFSLAQIGLEQNLIPSPRNIHSIQLRLCAEDAQNGFSLSVGKIDTFHIPSGHGVRVDTHVPESGIVVGSQFDNLLAKVIVTASSWKDTVLKARRVLTDTRVSGIQTNLVLLRGILSHEDFLAGRFDTQWLGNRLEDILRAGNDGTESTLQMAPDIATPSSVSSSSIPFQPGDAWSVNLEPLGNSHQREKQQQHGLQLTRILQNNFPNSLVAEIKYTTPSSSTAYQVQLASTSTDQLAVSKSRRSGDPNNPKHIILPISGTLIEVLVSPGDQVVENQAVAFIKQMKMELEVRSPRAGKVRWVYEMEAEEEEVKEGLLLVELENKMQEKL